MTTETQWSFKEKLAWLSSCSVRTLLHSPVPARAPTAQSHSESFFLLIRGTALPRTSFLKIALRAAAKSCRSKPVGEMVQISMQTWGCLSEQISKPHKPGEKWTMLSGVTPSCSARGWAALQVMPYPCLWVVARAAHFPVGATPDPPGDQHRSGTSLSYGTVVDMVGGGWKALPALPSDWFTWERFGESSEKLWGWAMGSGCTFAVWVPPRGETQLLSRARKGLWMPFFSLKYSHGP